MRRGRANPDTGGGDLLPRSRKWSPQSPVASYELDITVATGWYFALSLVGVCLSAAVAAVVGKGRVIDAIGRTLRTESPGRGSLFLVERQRGRGG